MKISGTDAIVSQHLGVLSIKSPQADSMIAYQVEGFGVVPGRNGVTLGYKKESVALIFEKQQCRVIIFELPDDQKAAEIWNDLLNRSDEICLLGGNDEETKPSGN